MIPGSARSPGEGSENPFQYSCLGNPMGRWAWQAVVHGVTKSQTQLSMHTCMQWWIELTGNWFSVLGGLGLPLIHLFLRCNFPEFTDFPGPWEYLCPTVYLLSSWLLSLIINAALLVTPEELQDFSFLGGFRPNKCLPSLIAQNSSFCLLNRCSWLNLPFHLLSLS